MNTRQQVLLGPVVMVCCIAFCFLRLFCQKMDRNETFAALEDPQIGTVQVVGRYCGLFNDWDVALFHKPPEADAEVRAYYLAHESPPWRHANLEVAGQRVLVKNRHNIVAEYDAVSGMFRHVARDVTYSKEDGLEAGRRVNVWEPSRSGMGR